ncbi:hypothetical protein Tco_0403967 [Tanacetum coccineum]
MGLPTTDEGISTSQPLPERTTTVPKDSGRTIQLIDRGLPFTTGFDQSGFNIKYQVDTTQSTRFEMSNLEDDIKGLSDEEMYEDGEEMDDPSLPADEETQPPPSTKNDLLKRNNNLLNITPLKLQRESYHLSTLIDL